MSLLQTLREMLRSLKKQKPKEFSVAVMPDFFLDRLVTYDGDVKHFSEAVAEVAMRKGGGIHGVKQLELRGGNAANTASALAALGATVHLIINTSPFGLYLLKFYLDPLGIDLTRVKTRGKTAITTAIELSYQDEKTNVMMSDLGSLPDFGPNDLTAEDFELLREVDYTCLFNWASTRHWGTELARGVFSCVKREGRGKTYYDTADPLPNKDHIPRLVKDVLSKDLVDVLSVNENEAFCYASELDEEVSKLRKTLKPGELAKECARTLTKNISARVDLHTATMGGSFTSNSEVIVPAFKVPVFRATGAGDAWNAGNIFGDALDLPHRSRLTLANAVAAYYISSPIGAHSTIPKLVDFCSKKLAKTRY